jgi:geranylgeranyl pyrophosphate synthase
MSQTPTPTSLKQLLHPCVVRAEAALAARQVRPGTPETLAEAMRYCVQGGKRLRPALVYLTSQAVGPAADDLLDRAAVAVELIHVYSLVHDDLPAMDDDALRRGQPTAHVKFGEAMAILVGDALQTRAFEAIAESGDPQAAMLVCELASGAGATGMVAGQVADMDLCDVPDGESGLEYIHARKTGALLRAAVRMGAIASHADDATLASLTTFAEALGLAFQVCDDLLDATATVEQLGKTPGKDAASDKRTYVTTLGLEGAQARAAHLTQTALDALAPLGEKANALVQLTQHLLNRTH